MSLLVAMQVACTSYGLDLVSCTFLWREALDFSAQATFFIGKTASMCKGHKGKLNFLFPLKCRDYPG